MALGDDRDGYELDGHYIAKLERGAVRWPGAAYRSGLRYILNVASDNELGFLPPPGTPANELELIPPSTLDVREEVAGRPATSRSHC